MIFMGLKNFKNVWLLISMAPVFLISGLVSAANEDYTHLNRSKVAASCGACHDASGRGKRGGGLLRGSPSDICLRCHGPSGKPEERAKSNIFVLLMKRSKHPVIETARYHLRGEDLPEKIPSMPRHVSCLDCHSAHMTRPANVLERVRGTALSGAAKNRAEKESEVCYNCHSDSINLPSTSSNMRLRFDPGNASYHPVERVAKGRSPSLFSSDISQGSFVTCTSCHEPHGSDYPPLLRLNYVTRDDAETQYSYELCYSCHKRDSILSNQSFKGSPTADYGHKEHIVYQKTSCYTCHTSHGNSINSHLIEFNPTVVTGMRHYVDYQGGRALCNLTCHTKVHQ